MRRILLLLVVVLLPAPLLAQRGMEPSPDVFLFSGRVGYDTQFNEPVVGAGVRVPTWLLEGLAVQAAGDFTFLPGVTERQLALDLMYNLRGLWVGGGAVFRNSYWDGNFDDRETRTGYSLFAAFGGTPAGRDVFAVSAEFRFVWVEDFSPRPFTLGINLAPGRLLGG